MLRLVVTIIFIFFFSARAIADISAFDTELEKLSEKHSLMGLSAAVVENGELVWAKGYGFADQNNEVPISPDTPFWIASLTKTFVGLSFLLLEHAEEAVLSDLAADTPEFKELCDWLAGTTIPFAQGLDCTQQIQIQHILHHQVNAPLGTKFLYNPIMYSRLSRYLEHRNGEGVRAIEGRHNYLAQSIDKYILDPLDMKRTMASMWDTTKTAVYFDLADGFKVDKGNVSRLKRPQRHTAGGAGMVSTVLDLAKYDIALSGNSFLPDSIKKRLLSPALFKDGSPSPYGFGWYFQTYKNETLMWHSGWDSENGYSAIHLRILNRNSSLILLSNSEGLWWNNPLDRAQIQDSEFAQAFFKFIGL